MRLKIVSMLVCACCVFLSASFCLGAENQSIEAPSAFLPEDKFESEAVLEGASITHEFVIQNKGTAPLKISRVKTT